MTRLSDEEKELLNPCKAKWFRHYWFIGFDKAESIYIPQIEKLQGEIERLKEYEWKYKELCK